MSMVQFVSMKLAVNLLYKSFSEVKIFEYITKKSIRHVGRFSDLISRGKKKDKRIVIFKQDRSSITVQGNKTGYFSLNFFT